MKALKTLLICTILSALVSCGASVRTVNPSNVDLSMYNSFAYLPNTNVEVSGKSYNDEEVNRYIVEAVKSNMLQRGFKIERNNPGLLVLISTSTNTEVETTREPVYATYPYTYGAGTVSPFYDPYYYRGYHTYGDVVGYDTDTYTYKEGTLVIDLIDRETKETVWKGVANDAIYDQSTSSAIRQMVDDIFDEFPIDNQR